MAALRAENVRLRALLNSSALLQDDVLVAELIGVSPDPTGRFNLTRQVIPSRIKIDADDIKEIHHFVVRALTGGHGDGTTCIQ